MIPMRDLVFQERVRRVFSRAVIVLRHVWLVPVRLYRRFLSPLKPASSCRFTPTCSQYALEAIAKYGALKGSYLAVRRILRCHPFYKGDLYDPVP